MADKKTFNTRIQLKYDLYSNWTTNNPVLLAGEIAVATIPAAEGATSLNHNSVALPQVLIKVGDGTSHYNTLPFASALAADVYPWAKESQTDFETRVKTLVAGLHYTKAEVYNKSEIDAFLAQYYKKTEIDAITGALADLNTTNKNNLVAAINEALQAVEVGGTGSVVSVIKEETPTEGSQATYKVTQGGNTVGVKIEIPVGYDETALVGRVSTIEGDYLKAADKTELEGKIGAKADTTTVEGIAGRVATIEGDYLKAADIANFETKENVKKVADDLAAYETANDAALAGVKATADAAAVKTEVDNALALKANAADVYTKAEADAEFMTQAEVDARVNQVITDAVDGDTLTSLTELVQYINEHGGDAAEMATAIAKLEAILAGIGGEGEKATVVAYVTDAIAALQIGDYAKAADLTALAARVKAIEDAPYATEAYADQAEADAIAAAKTETERQITALNIAQYETSAHAEATYEKIGVAQGLVDGLNIAQYETITGAEGKYATITNHNALAERVTATEGVANGAAAKAAENATAISGLNTEVAKKANTADLAAIATTGNVNDLVQTENDYIIFNCGTSSTVI